MSRIKRIVTSEIEGRNLNDFYGDNSYSIDSNGTINYYGQNKMGPVIEPGIVYGSNADSGDGYGYNTIKLVPHAPNGEINDDRYLIIDPTAPNHIHIRAGGTQDNSNAELILGAEQTNIKVTDYNKNVQVNTYNSGTDTYNSWNFDNNGNLTANQNALIGVSTAPGNLTLSAYSGTTFTYSTTEATNGVFIQDNTQPLNRVATLGDLQSSENSIGQVVSYNSTWSGTNLSFTGTPVTASYVKIGKLVQIQIEVEFDNVTNFGTGQYSLTLPFNSAYHTDAFGGSIHKVNSGTSHYSVKGHMLPSSNIMTLWSIGSNSVDEPVDHNSPANLTTADRLNMSFSYICE